MLNQKQEEVQRKRTEAEAIKRKSRSYKLSS